MADRKSHFIHTDTKIACPNVVYQIKYWYGIPDDHPWIDVLFIELPKKFGDMNQELVKGFVSLLAFKKLGYQYEIKNKQEYQMWEVQLDEQMTKLSNPETGYFYVNTIPLFPVGNTSYFMRTNKVIKLNEFMEWYNLEKEFPNWQKHKKLIER